MPKAEYNVDKWVFAQFLVEHDGHTQVRKATSGGAMRIECSCGDVLVLKSDPTSPRTEP
jgi:hypothetical protein